MEKWNMESRLHQLDQPHIGEEKEALKYHPPPPRITHQMQYFHRVTGKSRCKKQGFLALNPPFGCKKLM
jgi:hypothetical protein